MAKEILDIYVEQGYPYTFDLDFNATDGSDLEDGYNTYFYNEYIGTKTFSIVTGKYSLTLTAEDTGKLLNNLSNYVIYAVNTTTSDKEKLLTGRIVVDKKVGA